MPKLKTYIETQFSSQHANYGAIPSLDRYMEVYKTLPDSEKAEIEGTVVALGKGLKKKKGRSTGLGTLGAMELFGRLAEFLAEPDLDKRMELYEVEKRA